MTCKRCEVLRRKWLSGDALRPGRNFRLGLRARTTFGRKNKLKTAQENIADCLILRSISSQDNLRSHGAPGLPPDDVCTRPPCTMAHHGQDPIFDRVEPQLDFGWRRVLKICHGVLPCACAL